MFSKFKLRKAKKHDVKGVARLFADINQGKSHQDVLKLIEKGEVFVLKRKKKVRAAFSFAVYGIIGLFSVMYVKRLAVDKKMRGKGMGKHMLSKIKQMNLRRGTSLFFLYSLKQAQKFYEKNKMNRLWRYFWWRKEED